MIPENIIGLRGTLLTGLTSSNSSEVKNVEFAVLDELVGDLDEESGHSLVGVVVSGDGVDHLDTVHESRECLLDGLGGSIVEGLNELLESLEVLDVVLGLIKSLSDSELDSLPL